MVTSFTELRPTIEPQSRFQFCFLFCFFVKYFYCSLTHFCSVVSQFAASFIFFSFSLIVFVYSFFSFRSSFWLMALIADVKVMCWPNISIFKKEISPRAKRTDQELELGRRTFRPNLFSFYFGLNILSNSLLSNTVTLVWNYLCQVL